MLQKEFEQLIGREVNETENFGIIHSIYMATNYSKQQFAAEYVKKNHGDIAIELARMVDRIRHNIDGMLQEKKDEGYLWADEAHEMSSDRARRRAIEILGFKEYITYIVSKGWELWQIDKEDIIAAL